MKNKKEHIYNGLFYSLPDLLDRLSILKLKIENYPNESKNLEKEFKTFQRAVKAFKYNDEEKTRWLDELHKINKEIWLLESNIRRGDIENIPLSEIGKTAIQIRIVNGKRVKLKGDIADKTKSGFRDIKINHASE